MTILFMVFGGIILWSICGFIESAVFARFERHFRNRLNATNYGPYTITDYGDLIIHFILWPMMIFILIY